MEDPDRLVFDSSFWLSLPKPSDSVEWLESCQAWAVVNVGQGWGHRKKITLSLRQGSSPGNHFKPGLLGNVLGALGTEVCVLHR